jgi:hypothetical protein
MKLNRGTVMNFEIDNNGCLTKYNGKSKRVEIPEGVTSIGEAAFRGCTSLTEIKLSKGVTSIGDIAFWGCSRLKSVIIAEGVTSIGEDAFSECTSLTEIKLPESVTSIGGDAFYDCASLIEIKLPKSITSIGYGAFHYCTSLTKIELPEGVTSIGEEVFSGCASLTEIKLQKGVTSIGNEAFARCSSLTAIRIPASVTVIGENAFSRCDKLEFIIIDNEAAREKICALLPAALLSKVITQAAHQYHLKEKEKIKVSVLSAYLLENMSQNTTRYQPNIFSTTVLPYLNEKRLHNGNTDLLKFIFSFLSADDIKEHVPGLVKALEPILFSDGTVPRMYPSSTCDKANYTQSKKEYNEALQHAVTQYVTVSTEIVESETAVTASKRHCKM